MVAASHTTCHVTQYGKAGVWQRWCLAELMGLRIALSVKADVRRFAGPKDLGPRYQGFARLAWQSVLANIVYTML